MIEVLHLFVTELCALQLCLLLENFQDKFERFVWVKIFHPADESILCHHLNVQNVVDETE